MTKQIFLSGKFYQWHLFKNSNCKIWLAGYESEKKIKKIFSIIKSSKKINSYKIKSIINSLGEHFGIVIFSKFYSFAAVDYTRSYPLFWSFKNKSLSLSVQARLIKNKNINSQQLTAFRMSGYTTGTETLWEDVEGLLAGSYLLLDDKSKILIKRYFTYIPIENKKIKYKDLQQTLSKEITKIIKKLIIDARGKTIVIPLSAGMDSRLIASGLKKFNYTNVRCFSYGLENNYEAVASKKIAKALGYEWTFVKINQKNIKKFYKSQVYKDYLKNSSDGASTSTIQGLYAIYILKKTNFINKESLIVNGNSGDFISGGHIPGIIQLAAKKGKLSDKELGNIITHHLDKHYSLWPSLKTKKNIGIINSMLKIQVKKTIRNKSNISPYAILELLEYENRQTKYVVNAQRIYDNFQLNWTLPLWNKSFIKFWEKIPLKYKINQKLYKETLTSLNYGGVWTKDYNFKLYVTPKIMQIVRFLFKVIFFFIGKNKWYLFEKKYLSYWTENILGFSSISYIEFIKNKNIARNYVSLYTLLAEKINLGSHWQKKS